MKKLLTLFALSVLFAFQSMGAKSYEMEVLNLVQLNETEFTFDVRMRNLNVSEPFAIEAIQWQFSFNTAILNGGLFNNTYLTYVSGTTDLVGSAIIPSSTNFTSNNVVTQWITDALSDGGQTTLFNDGSWKRIGTFRVQLRNADNTAFNNFADAAHNFAFVTDQVIVNACNYTTSAGLYYRSGSSFELITTKTLTNSVSSRQLAGYCFTGTSYWSVNSQWNNITTANNHTLPGASNNAIIAGAATVNDAQTVNDVTINTTTQNLPSVSTGTFNSALWAAVKWFYVDGNNVSSAGDATVTGRGIILGASSSVTISNATTTFPYGSGGVGTFDISISSDQSALEGQYFRAYATSSIGTAYGAAFRLADLLAGQTAVGGSITSYSSLYLTPTGQLTSGNLYNDAGQVYLLIQSTASGTGSLIHNTAGVTATVERYITAGTWADGTDGWHLLSSPVAAQAIDPEFTSSGGGEYDFYAWSEPAQVWLNQKVGANNITTFNVGQGYLAAYQNTDTKVFSGALNIADKSVTLTQNAGTYTGWNLLGNPYSSALTWNTGWTLTNIGGVAQIWNEDIKDYSLINAGAAIPAMNGFMVYTSAASQSLTIPAAQRVHSATAWYKSAAQQIELIAHDPQGESAKSSFIGFDSKATAGFDLEYDAYLLSGYAPKFYSVAGGSEFSLNTLPEAVSNLTIPFGFVKNASSSFSIELAQSIEGHSVWLRDLLTNTVVNLSDTPVYSFTSADGDNAARFEIVLDMFTGTSDLKALASAYAYSADNRIVVTGVNGETKMDVISIQGQVLKTFEFFSTGQHDVSVNLSTGVYLVRLYNSGEIRAMKVMVK